MSECAEPSADVNVTLTEMNGATLAFVGVTPDFVPLNWSSVRAGSVPPLFGGGLFEDVEGGFEGVVVVGVVGVVDVGAAGWVVVGAGAVAVSGVDAVPTVFA